MSNSNDPTKRTISAFSLPKDYTYSLFLLTILFVLSAIGAKYPLLGLIIAILEWLYLILQCINKNYFKAFCLIIVFITTSFETTTFVSEVVSDDLVVYSIYSLPYVRSILCYALIIFLGIIFHCKYAREYRKTTKRSAAIRKVIRLLPIMAVTGVITGFIVYLANDNGVAELGWYFTKYIEFTIKIITLMSLIYTTALICSVNKMERSKLESLCEQLIICFVLATIITLALGFRGHYGSKGTLIFMPLATSLASGLMLFAGYKKRNGLLCFILGAVFTAVILFIAGSPMGSKFYIIPIASFLLLVLVGIKSRRIGSFAGVVVIIIIILTSGGAAITSTYLGTYNNWKFTQLIQLFQIQDNSFATWYSQLPNSPRIRVDEFMSILQEYISKPWFALFGKGTAGTITHLWGDTIWTIKGGGAFSDYEIDSGVFMFMHESVNVLFIRHGLLGLYFLVVAIIALFKRLLKTPWALIALIWIIFYWGTYRSWWIGAVALVLALTADHTNNIRMTIE